jgi:hypothetical protein
VRIVHAAPVTYRPSQVGSVVGFREVSSARGQRQGTDTGRHLIVSVQFPDGETLEIPDQYLELNLELPQCSTHLLTCPRFLHSILNDAGLMTCN